MGVTGFETFVHREYAELFASVPAIAVGSIAAFMLKDRLSGEAVPNAADLRGQSTEQSQQQGWDRERADRVRRQEP